MSTPVSCLAGGAGHPSSTPSWMGIASLVSLSWGYSLTGGYQSPSTNHWCKSESVSIYSGDGVFIHTPERRKSLYSYRCKMKETFVVQYKFVSTVNFTKDFKFVDVSCPFVINIPISSLFSLIQFQFIYMFFNDQIQGLVVPSLWSHHS